MLISHVGSLSKERNKPFSEHVQIFMNHFRGCDIAGNGWSHRHEEDPVWMYVSYLRVKLPSVQADVIIEGAGEHPSRLKES